MTSEWRIVQIGPCRFGLSYKPTSLHWEANSRSKGCEGRDRRTSGGAHAIPQRDRERENENASSDKMFRYLHSTLEDLDIVDDLRSLAACACSFALRLSASDQIVSQVPARQA